MWRRTLLLSICSLAVASAMAVALPAARVAAQDGGVANPTASGDAATLASLVNSYRAQNGLSQLIVDPTFSANTQPFAFELIGQFPPTAPEAGFANGCPTGSLYHDSGGAIAASAPAGTVGWAENAGYVCRVEFAQHASAIFEGLKNSPSHNATMLNPRWTHMGSAAVTWGFSTVAVHRFAEVPGSGAPASAVAAPTAIPTVNTAPATRIDPEPTQVPSSPVAKATGAQATEAAAPEPTKVFSGPSTAITAPTAVPTVAAVAPAPTEAVSGPSTALAPTATAVAAADDTSGSAATSSENSSQTDTETESASDPAGAPALAFTGGSSWLLAAAGIALVVSGQLLKRAGSRVRG